MQLSQLPLVQIVKFQCLSNREFPEFFKTHPTYISRSILKGSRSLQTKTGHFYFPRLYVSQGLTLLTASLVNNYQVIKDLLTLSEDRNEHFLLSCYCVLSTYAWTTHHDWQNVLDNQEHHNDAFWLDQWNHLPFHLTSSGSSLLL